MNKVLKSLLPLLFSKSSQDPSTRRRIPLAVSALIAGKLLSVQTPLLFKHLIDNVSSVHPDSLLLPGTLLIGYGAARIGSSLFGELKNILFSRLSIQAQLTAAVNTFTHLHQTSSSFLHKQSTATLSRTIDRGVRGMSFAVTAAIFNVVPTIVEVGLVGGLLFVYFPGRIEYFGVAMGTIVSYSVYTILLTQWRLQFRKKMNNAENAASKVAADSLMHHEAVKLANTEKIEATGYAASLQGYVESATKTASSLAVLNSGQQALVSLGMVTLMALVLRDISLGTAMIGDLVLVNGLMFQLAIPLNFLGGVYRELRQAFIDMEAMFDLSKVPVDIVDGSRELVLAKGPQIKFENVSFAHRNNNGVSDNQKVLEDLDLEIPAGQRVAIVGPSGSGKSTIAKLLTRLVDPNEGRITIDGVDIKEFTLGSLRRNIAVVPQDAAIFNQSISYNIKYGVFDAESRIEEKAIQTAQMSNLMQKSELGKNTIIGERGLTLSGGERQRIAIARAILKDSPIVVLDEATSALDNTTESKILAALKNEWDGKTQIVIAHRLSTIVDADRIVVLDIGGRVVGQGTHDELLKSCDLYQELWKSHNK